MDAPGKAGAGCCVEDFIFLRVVEVIDVKAALLFAEWSGRQSAFAVGLEGAEVVLEAGDEGYVVDGVRGARSGEEVPDHGAIDADVFFLCGLAQPGGDEDVSRFEMSDGGGEGGGIEEVGGDEVDAFEAGGWTAGEAVHLPSSG